MSCAPDGRAAALRSSSMRTLVRSSLIALFVVSTAAFAQAPSASPASTPPVPVAGAPGGSTDPVATKPDAKDTKPSAKDSKQPDASTAKASDLSATAKADSIPSPGEALDPHIKKGSEDDVDAVGTRDIGRRGLGNWFSVNWEISNGKQYSMEIEKSAHVVTDPVVAEYVNRIGQNIVKNSDCKVPFTIKVLDSDAVSY